MKKLKSLTIIMLTITINVGVVTGCGSSKAPTTEKTAQTESANKFTYEPITITVDLDRSGKGDKVEEIFKKAPTKAVTLGDEFTDILLDLGLEGNMAGRTVGSAKSVRTTFDEAKKSVSVLAEKDLTKEQLLSAEGDFIIGWDSNFTDKKFGKDFCKENAIDIYTPKFTSDNATIDDLYEDYTVLGKIFGVSDVAKTKVTAMKEKIKNVQDKLSQSSKESTKSVFVFDSGEKAPFTACQGMPGNLIKLAGGKTIFDDIDKGWATVSWEEVVKRNPEVIIIMDYGNGDVNEKEKFLYSNQSLKDVDAIKNKQVYPVVLCDMEGGAGSALVVEDLAKILHPDLFK